ncbi:MAG TPA: hypothetical protein VFZ63_18200 [Jiangellaceae bacterium]
MRGPDAYLPETPHHHGTHRNLLTVVNADVAPRILVDAVMVPATRSVEALDTAIDLTHELGSVLVAFCSGEVSAEQVIDRAAGTVSVVAIDIDTLPKDCLPTFETSAVVTDSRFERFTDLSQKRNLALLLSRISGWRRVLLLDDDIHHVSASDVCAAAGLLKRFDAVGLRNRGFPDNSVVCHVSREVGYKQGQFIGAGGLVITPAKAESFFPDIYNEDWFYLLGLRQPLRLAATGRMRHQLFNPFADPDRARREELGDCMAEGLFWLLDEGRSIDDADVNHWRQFLDHRRQFIDSLLQQLDPVSDVKMIASLEAAGTICSSLIDEPDICEGYVHLWRSDIDRWRQFLHEKPDGLGVEKSLAELGWLASACIDLAPARRDDPLLCLDGWFGSAQDSLSSGAPGRYAL